MSESKSQIKIPDHLKKYVVDQNYSRYTAEDQAVWRYIMRRLVEFLRVNAHECYVDGLKKTGIEIDEIPRIEVMDEKLSQFGWGAVPVSGFIPPAAFMEFQSLGILPIASDMRTIDHILYTPAPDIVHEAAGHAPILVDPKFAKYLKNYAEVASKAIIGKEDLDQYEAIRLLSDTKERPDATDKDIQVAEKKLEEANANISFVSEAALLGRMNWWTAEYGLIGTLDKPKIFGAGLLSSIGESQECLSAKIKKIPLSVKCIDYSYDITEPQPQLFVTGTFENLNSVLEDLANQMAFREGGKEGLEKAKLAQTVNTIEYSSGLQVSGKLDDYLSINGTPIYIKLAGPTQLSISGKELSGHGKEYHSEGFGSPIGRIKGMDQCLSLYDQSDLHNLGYKEGNHATLEFETGVCVKGLIKGFMFKNKKLVLIKFDQCTVKRGTDLLFDPSWGYFDMAVGEKIESVFGGPADRIAYGETEDFVASRVPEKKYSPAVQELHYFYEKIRRFRTDVSNESEFFKLCESFFDRYPQKWLLGVELLELAFLLKSEEYIHRLSDHLNEIDKSYPDTLDYIREGVRLASLKL